MIASKDVHTCGITSIRCLILLSWATLCAVYAVKSWVPVWQNGPGVALKFIKDGRRAHLSGESTEIRSIMYTSAQMD